MKKENIHSSRTMQTESVSYKGIESEHTDYKAFYDK